MSSDCDTEVMTSATLATPTVSQATATSSSMPTAVLPYATYAAAAYNAQTDVYIFKNIRFAAPPTGPLRFQPPQSPVDETSLGVQDGSVGNICYQADPMWIQLELIALASAAAAAASSTGAAVTSTSSAAAAATPTPPQSEDCLFLDVYVPGGIVRSGNLSSANLPVMVWVYGGGYTNGYKDEFPGNLLINAADNQLIYVAINYRLGAFGWLAGPTYQSNATANLGLYDQRAAFEWVQEYIELFGGSKNDVTVFGESAGGGSLMHQLTAYGSTDSPPFQKMIPQSPGWAPQYSPRLLEAQYQTLQIAANCTSLQCLKDAPAEVLAAASYEIVTNAPYGSFVFGPAVDGTFVPALPGYLLLIGAFPKNVQMMSGHNADEGYIFTPKNISTETDFETYVYETTSTTNPAVVAEIVSLYPPPSNSTPYTSNFERATLLTSELIFTCNTRYLAIAFGNNTYNYLFNVPPALHGQDIVYTFGAGANQTVTAALEGYLTSFARFGNPSDGRAAGTPEFPIYGDAANLLELGIDGFPVVADSNANARCEFWQKALYI
ncbi:hypothetical protein YB2330_002552 [Saitoella coloradoensis]